MTRGQCGWLDLHCLGLAPFTTVPACPGADPNARGGPPRHVWHPHATQLPLARSAPLLCSARPPCPVCL